MLLLEPLFSIKRIIWKDIMIQESLMLLIPCLSFSVVLFDLISSGVSSQLDSLSSPKGCQRSMKKTKNEQQPTVSQPQFLVSSSSSLFLVCHSSVLKDTSDVFASSFCHESLIMSRINTSVYNSLPFVAASLMKESNN